MLRFVAALFFSIAAALIVLSPKQADAGDYYYDERPRYSSSYHDDGYRYRPYRSYDRPYYYRRVVRYEKVYRDYDRPYYRPRYRNYTSYDPYYERPYYRSYRPYYRSYTSSYYDYPRYRSYSYPSYRYSSYPSYRYSDYTYRTSSWSGSDQPRSFYPAGCRPKSYKVYDDQGGWVWAKKSVCW